MCKYNFIKGFKNESLGLVIIFEDLIEVCKMVEEFIGIKKMVWLFRV